MENLTRDEPNFVKPVNKFALAYCIMCQTLSYIRFFIDRMKLPSTRYRPNGNDACGQSTCESASLDVTNEPTKSVLPGPKTARM